MPTKVDNLYAGIPDHLPGEHQTHLVESGHLRIERIVSEGHRSPKDYWYDQQENEWVLLLKGRARIRFEAPNDMVDLLPGDHLFLPAHCKHRVEWTAPGEKTVWLAVHYPAEEPS